MKTMMSKKERNRQMTQFYQKRAEYRRNRGSLLFPVKKPGERTDKGCDMN